MRFLLLFLITSAAAAQNADSLFSAAQQHARAGNYAEAEREAADLVKWNPGSKDFLLFYVRTLGWQKKYSAARALAEPGFHNDPGDNEFAETYTDILLWSADYPALSDACDRALQVQEHNGSLLYKKALALYHLGDLDASQKAAMKARAQAIPQAEQLLKDIHEKKTTSHAAIGTMLVWLQTPSQVWGFATAEYKKGFQKCPTIARVTGGNTGDDRPAQIEVEAYPRLGKKNYALLMAGASVAGRVFPNAKAGAEIYFQQLKNWEFGIGTRYMKFSATEVILYHGQAARYIGRWWLAYRPFLLFNSGKTYLTHHFIARCYNRRNLGYFNLIAGSGISPYTFTFLQEIQRLNSSRAGIELYMPLKGDFALKPLLLYEYEEYFPGLWRSRVNMQLILLKRFK